MQTYTQLVEMVAEGVSILSSKRLLWKKRRLQTFVNQVLKELDSFERVPVLFGEDVPHGYKELLNALTLFISEVSAFPSKSLELALKRRLVALLYRLEESHGGKNPQPVNGRYVQVLKEKVQEWKLQEAVVTEKRVSDSDLIQIQELSRYPECAALLLEDEDLWKNFLLFSIRDGNSVALFVQYPAIQKRVVTCELSSRIGRVDPRGLKVVKRLSGRQLEKVVTLPFEGRDESILDESLEILFRGKTKATIAEVFNVFAKKRLEVGNFEYLAAGITNWNAHLLAFWDNELGNYKGIDLSYKRWWYELPIFEVISKSALEERHSIQLKEGEWSVAAVATRGSATLDYEQSHAFFEIAMPWGDGRYAIYDFGKFAKQFPATFFESLSIFCHNVHATVAYPDENVYYSQREHAYQGFAATESEALALMERIRKDMIHAKRNDFVYQIESDNCAKWVYENLEKMVGIGRVPDLFRLHLLKTEPFGLVSWIFAAIRKLPQKWQTPVLTFCHRPMGAAKRTWIFEDGGVSVKSLTRHQFWQTGVVFLPAMLHHQKEKGLFYPPPVIEVVASYFERFWRFIRTVRLSFKLLFKRFSERGAFSLYSTPRWFPCRS